MSDNYNRDYDDEDTWVEKAGRIIWLLPSAAVAIGIAVLIFRAITGI